MICNCAAGAAGRRCAAGGGSRTGGSGSDGSRSGGRGADGRGSLGRACGCPRKHCKSKCLQQLPDQHGYGIGAGDRSGKIYQRLHLLPRGRTVIQVYPDSKQNLPSVPPGRWTPLAIFAEVSARRRRNSYTELSFCQAFSLEVQAPFEKSFACRLTLFTTDQLDNSNS